MSWCDWLEEASVKGFTLRPDASLINTIIPTVDNTSRLYLLDMLIQADKPVLLYGNTGVFTSLSS